MWCDVMLCGVFTLWFQLQLQLQLAIAIVIVLFVKGRLYLYWTEFVVSSFRVANETKQNETKRNETLLIDMVLSLVLSLANAICRRCSRSRSLSDSTIEEIYSW
mmetsp:Transcript_7303/g.14352  ORF Transcript_7303/g.14352 Transcript_7303/m.14352 type:complete len:104 (+) Transcript_7303:2401-2712(+)